MSSMQGMEAITTRDHLRLRVSVAEGTPWLSLSRIAICWASIALSDEELENRTLMALPAPFMVHRAERTSKSQWDLSVQFTRLNISRSAIRDAGGGGSPWNRMIHDFESSIFRLE